MLPTLHSGDMVLLTKDYPEPRRGDIVFTQVIEEGRPVEIVKRVIGLPGDTVEIKQDVAIVNGDPGAGPRPGCAAPVRRVGRGVPNSARVPLPDGRQPDGVARTAATSGPAAVSGVKGRVVAIYAPINRVGTVH